MCYRTYRVRVPGSAVSRLYSRRTLAFRGLNVDNRILLIGLFVPMPRAPRLRAVLAVLAAILAGLAFVVASASAGQAASIEADLAVAISPAAPSPAVPGNSVSWTVTLINSGPSDAVNPSLTDTVPATVTGVVVTAAPADWACNVTSQDVACTAPSLALATSVSFTITGALAPDFTGSVSDTVTTTSDTPDVDPSNNSATSNTLSAPSADLLAIKSQATPNPVVPGGPVSWTITVTNAGPSDAVNPVVTDAVNSQAPLPTIDPLPAGWTCVQGGQNLSCTAASMATGTSATFQVSGELVPRYIGDLPNTATVTSDTADPDLGNNVSTSVTPTAPSADVAVAITPAVPNPVVPGTSVSWTVTVVNNGLSWAVNPSVSDVLPDGMTGITVSGVQNLWSCQVTGQTVSCTAPTLSVGAAATFTIIGDLAPDFTGVLVNPVTAGSETFDPDLANNTATSSTPSAPAADLAASISKTTPNPAVAGKPVSWSVSVTNAGPSTAVNPSITNSLPVGVSGIAVGSPGPAGWTCTVTTHQVACQALSLAAGATATFSISADLAGDFSGAVVASAGITSDTPDPVPADNSASSSTPSSAAADLLAVKSVATPEPARPGQAVIWTVTVTNDGPSTAVAPTLKDAVTDGVSGVLATTTATGWTCAVVGQNVTCTAAAMSAGTSITATITGTLSATFTGALVNTATVTSTTADPTPANNTSTSTTSTASLLLSSKATPVTVTAAGQTVAYSFEVTNSGSATVTNLAIADQFQGSAGPVPSISCPVSTLPGGGSTICTAADYTVKQSDLDAGFIGNTATVSGDDPLGHPVTSRTATVTVQANQAATLGLVNTAALTDTNHDGAVGRADTLTWSLTVTNTGNVTLDGLLIHDPVAASISCAATTLLPGAATSCTSAPHPLTQAEVDAGSLTNSATATAMRPCPADAACPLVSSAAATVTTKLAGTSVLTLVKKSSVADTNSDGRTDAGDVIAWTIVVGNGGTTTIKGLKVSDPTAGTVTCPGATIVPGSELTCSVPRHTITDAEAATGSVSNTATASATNVADLRLSAVGSATVHPRVAPLELPMTGVPLLPQLLSGALLLGVGAGFTVLAGRGRRRV
ncbi:MAG: hypothetical protein QOE71_3887 [Pseudonocardiales bacterium]|nr:hypothetical protein [Pseudonocardiales bacterium]